MSNIYEYITNRTNGLYKRLGILEKVLEDSPEGYLREKRRSNGNVFYYVESSGTQGTKARYLPKSDAAELESYASKRYAQRVIPSIKKELKACESYLHLCAEKDEAEIADEMDTEFLNLVPKLTLSKKLYCKNWVAQSYPSKNTQNPENLTCQTLRGEFVRSKSEAMIADALYRADVPYLYEFPLQLKQLRYPIYPDFTILNKNSLQELYWEHCGRMDDTSYVRRFTERMELYTMSGIAQKPQLITTFEMAGNPLSSRTVEKIITDLFP